MILIDLDSWWYWKSCRVPELSPSRNLNLLGQTEGRHLHQAAVRADDYSLMHKVVYGKNHPRPFDHTDKRLGERSAPSDVHGSGQPTPRVDPPQWVVQI